MNFPNCRYFHYDAYRGREVMRCRLLEESGHYNEWSLKLCGNCPVPSIVQETTCNGLLLEAEVVRGFLGFFPRVEVFAACGDSIQKLANPKRCSSCEKKAEQRRNR
ncbi:MAG: hypothetical protein ACPGWR_26090 [Ardenticatenaceae bacterium]